MQYNPLSQREIQMAQQYDIDQQNTGIPYGNPHLLHSTYFQQQQNRQTSQHMTDNFSTNFGPQYEQDIEKLLELTSQHKDYLKNKKKYIKYKTKYLKLKSEYEKHNFSI